MNEQIKDAELEEELLKETFKLVEEKTKVGGTTEGGIVSGVSSTIGGVSSTIGSTIGSIFGKYDTKKSWNHTNCYL